jgi:protein-disulfide isomerase
LNGKHDRVLSLAIVLMLVLSGFVMLVAAPTAQNGSLGDATRNKIQRYIRERFGIPDTVKLLVGDFHTSAAAPSFDEGTVTVDDGKNQHAQEVLVSKDARYLIVVTGSVIDLHQQNSATEMAQRIREAFKTPENIKLSVGGFKRSAAPDFQVGSLTIDDGKSKQERPVLLSQDAKHLIVSEIYSLAVDPREQALHTISLRDEATQGPANAPVTIVEYADLQCPTCARVHDFLETKLLPRYDDKVRVVFKEFPLAMHDWSTTAAIACQCAYELNPSSFVPLRTAIFRSQQLINITNLRDMLLNFGEQAGLNRVQLAGCLDAKSSYPRIQRDMAEAKRLNVNQTPTLYINGRMMIGLPSEDAYYQLIDKLLSGDK